MDVSGGDRSSPLPSLSIKNGGFRRRAGSLTHRNGDTVIHVAPQASYQSALRQSVRHVGHSEAGIEGLSEESSGNCIRNVRHAGTAQPDGLAPRPQYLAGERRDHCPPGSRRKDTIRHISILEVEQGGSIAKRGAEAWRTGHPPLQGRGDAWTLIFCARWRCSCGADPARNRQPPALQDGAQGVGGIF